MISNGRGALFEPFFLSAPRGERFCIFHPPVGAPRGGVVYIHPFAEEMNKSRRMAALQSRALAAAGYAVLQIDLFGCGDSSGDFSEAGWEQWRQDVALGVQWLSDRANGDIVLWGLRLGALLALDSGRFCNPLPKTYVLWQPVLSGEVLITQFLRLRLANEMLSGGSAKTGVKDLRAQLSSGTAIEVAGYLLPPLLTAAIEGLRLADLSPEGCKVHWHEVVAEGASELSPAARRVADAWLLSGTRVGIHCVPGPQFWNTVETTECPELITATTTALLGGSQ